MNKIILSCRLCPLNFYFFQPVVLHKRFYNRPGNHQNSHFTAAGFYQTLYTNTLHNNVLLSFILFHKSLCHISGPAALFPQQQRMFTQLFHCYTLFYRIILCTYCRHTVLSYGTANKEAGIERIIHNSEIQFIPHEMFFYLPGILYLGIKRNLRISPGKF